jgi:hypothetical protein
LMYDLHQQGIQTICYDQRYYQEVTMLMIGDAYLTSLQPMAMDETTTNSR